MYTAQDWKLKYRPTTLDYVILPGYVRKKLEGFKSGNLIQNWLFYGPPGAGKTTCSLLLRDLEYDTYFINCSQTSSIDDIRKLEQIGSSVTMTGNRRLFVLDEAEKLSKEAMKSLRGVIEHLSVANDFILTANDITKIDKAVLSRLNEINFDYEKDGNIYLQIRNRLTQILELEGFEIDDDIDFELDLLLNTIIDSKLPIDIRRLIGKLQILSYDWNN